VTAKKQAKKPAAGQAKKPLAKQPRAVSYYLGHPASEEEAAIYVREFIRHDLNHRAAVAATWPDIKGTKLTDLCRALKASADFKKMTKGHMSQVTERAGMDAENCAEILLGHADVSILDFLDDDFSIKPMAELRQLPRKQQRALKNITITDHYNDEGVKLRTTTKLELYDAQNAIKVMGEILGWTKQGDNNQFNIAQYILGGEKRIEKGVTMDAQPPDS